MPKNNESGEGFVEKHLMPIAVKLSVFKPLIAIRDGITLAMPLIIIGSLFLILGSFPVEAWTSWLENTVTQVSHTQNDDVPLIEQR